MKNINAKKVLKFDKNTLYTWNNATPSYWDKVRKSFTKLIHRSNFFDFAFY